MNNAPIQQPAGDAWSSSWVQWFASVVLALGGWRKTLSKTVNLDFPSVPAQGQTSASFALAGARQGDSVLVTPYADVAGVTFSGITTASDVVTIYAKNCTASAINPAAQDFRITLFQN